jgi:hypothetical protein
MGIINDIINREFLGNSERTLADVVSFCESDWGAKVKLFPIQRFVLKMFYGMPLDRENKTIAVFDKFRETKLFDFTEYEYLQYLYNQGRCNVNEDGHQFNEMAMVIGRRGTKSTVTSLITAYEYYKILHIPDPFEYYSLMRGGEIKIINIANGQKPALNIFNTVKNIVSTVPILDRFKSNITKQEVRFRTQWEIENEPNADGAIVGQSGGSLSRTMRGSSSIVVVLDELAHFIDNGGVASSEKVYDALTPSVSSFVGKGGKQEGKIISLSSPLNRSGQLWKLYTQGMAEGKKSGLLILQMPSWEINPNLESDFLRSRFKRDSSVFMVEYGAEFGDSKRSWLKDKDTFKSKCIIPGNYKFKGDLGQPYFIGMDIGSINDGTAITVGHWEADKLVVDYSRVYYGHHTNYGLPDRYDFSRLPVETPQSLKSIAKEVAELCKRFYIVKGYFDQYGGLAFLEHLKEAGVSHLEMLTVTRTLNSEIYSSLGILIAENNVQLPVPHEYFKDGLAFPESEPFIKELFNLEESQHSKYVVTVEAPPVEGMHDDQSDSLARMAYCATKFKNNFGKRTYPTYSARESAGKTASSYTAFHTKRSKLHGTNTYRSNKKPR